MILCNAVYTLNIWTSFSAKSVDLDQTAPKENSDLDLHCLC